MKSGDKLMQLVDGEPPLRSRQTCLVAALITVGATLDADQPFREFREVHEGKPRRRCMWLLKSKTQLGVDLKAMLKNLPPELAAVRRALEEMRPEIDAGLGAWEIAELWGEKNPYDSEAFVCAGVENFRKLLAALQDAGWMNVVRRGKKEAHIPWNASDEEKKKLMDMLAA